MGFFSRKEKLDEGLAKTRKGFFAGILDMMNAGSIDDSFYDDLEDQLILAVNPAPFCILDEIEAALDDVNVVRYAQYLQRICGATQFIVITHRRGTMEAANVLYGVTMQEDGVSKLLKLDLEHVDATLVS